MPATSQAAELNKMVLVSQQKNINEPSLPRSGGGADQSGTHIPALKAQARRRIKGLGGDPRGDNSSEGLIGLQGVVLGVVLQSLSNLSTSSAGS